MSNETLTYFRGHAFVSHMQQKRLAYVAYSSKYRKFVVAELQDGRVIQGIKFHNSLESALEYYQDTFDGNGAVADHFINPVGKKRDDEWAEYTPTRGDYRWMNALAKKLWRDPFTLSHAYDETDWERNAHAYEVNQEPLRPMDSGRMVAEKVTPEPAPETEIKIYRGHSGKHQQRWGAYFVCEKDGEFRYVSFGSERGVSRLSFTTLERAVSHYEGRCQAEYRAGVGELWTDRYNNGGNSASLKMFLRELELMGHPYICDDYKFTRVEPMVGRKEDQMPLTPPAPIGLEKDGWELQGAVLQHQTQHVRADFNGAILLWGRPDRKNELIVETLGFSAHLKAMTVTSNLGNAISVAHNICRDQRAKLERSGDSRGIDGVNEFGLGISNLGKGRITINRVEHSEGNSGGPHSDLRKSLSGKGVYGNRILEILEYQEKRAAKKVAELKPEPCWQEAIRAEIKELDVKIKEQRDALDAAILEQTEGRVSSAHPNMTHIAVGGRGMGKTKEAEEWVAGVPFDDRINFLNSKGEQTMNNEPKKDPVPHPGDMPLSYAIDPRGQLTEAEKTILEKYQDETKDIELQRVIKELESVKAEQEKMLVSARTESRKLKTNKKKRATMMQTMSLSAVFTLLTYLILARVFGRPVPNLQLTNPDRKRRLKRRRERAQEDVVSNPIAALSPPAFDEPVPGSTSTRRKARVAR